MFHADTFEDLAAQWADYNLFAFARGPSGPSKLAFIPPCLCLGGRVPENERESQRRQEKLRWGLLLFVCLFVCSVVIARATISFTALLIDI